MHPEFLRDLKFDVTASAACQVTFYTFLALSRMVLAPSILWCYELRPSSVIMAGSGLGLLSCIPALIWPTHLLAVLVLVAGLGTGVGPIEAMCISMIKEYKELTRIIPGLGAGSFFLVKHVMCWLLLVVTLIVDRCFLQNDAEVSGGDGCTDSPQKESGEAHDSRV
ncbi:speE [Symbiodinium microadriaticum]|nr:speE [Symbiodinium microadriaticum]